MCVCVCQYNGNQPTAVDIGLPGHRHWWLCESAPWLCRYAIARQLLYCCNWPLAITVSQHSCHIWTQVGMKKRSEETQTLCAGCSKAKPTIFAPPQTPFPGMQDGQNLISWRLSLPLPTNPVWWGRCTQFRVIMVTDPQTQTHPPTDRTDYNTLRRS